MKNLPINNKRTTAIKRIDGGEFADPGEWPWQVLLQRKNRTKILKRCRNKSFCGGAILSEHFALTALHSFLSGNFNNLTTILSRSEANIKYC